MLIWNFEKEEYKPYVPPKAGKYVLTGNPNMKCNCASCGKEVYFGNMYTSFKIHSEVGFSYGVCGKCYKAEFIERNRCER